MTKGIMGAPEKDSPIVLGGWDWFIIRARSCQLNRTGP